MTLRAYIAGPLFNEGERWFDAQIEQIATAAGISTFLPQRDGMENKSPGPDRICRIFREDVAAIDNCDVVIANLNGVTTDDGTAWELGYAYARGKHLIGVYTDWRLTFEDQVVNLMIQCALNHIARSLDELRTYLNDYVAGRGI